MLMAVQKQLRLCARNVIRESGEASMHFILAVVDKPWRVVRDKNIDPREGDHCSLDFSLVEQVVAAQFVFPRACETTEGNVANAVSRQVEVTNGLLKRRAGVMV